KHNNIVFSDPYVRSLSINDHGIVTCSSVSGNTPIVVPNWQSEHHSIRFFYAQSTPFKNKLLYPQEGTLILKLSYLPHYSVNIALYPELFNQLLRAKSQFGLTMTVENAVLDGDKTLLTTPRSIASLFTLSYELSPTCIITYIIHSASSMWVIWTIILFVIRRPLSQVFDTVSLDYWRIRRGLKKQQFEPYLQPVFDIDGKLTGAEVLARWVHPKRGIISPYEFIDIAEKNGQINQISAQLMQKCALHLHNSVISSAQSFNLGFNVSAIQFDNDTFFEDMAQLKEDLSDTGIQLTIELTERQAFSSQEKYMFAAQQLKACGVKVSLDDFGTGYCSLSYLLSSDIDIIKIDRSYIRTIDEGPNTHVLDSIIELAKRTNSLLLAEGVETTAQFDYLKQVDVERYQGFLFEKPMPIDQFKSKYLNGHSNN
ncbi:EAL domain-containing protein, partial [Vibrio viridaestus]